MASDSPCPRCVMRRPPALLCLLLNENWTDSKWECDVKHTVTAPEDGNRLKERREGGMEGGREEGKKDG